MWGLGLDPRRQAWRDGFERLGEYADVRDTYDAVYRSQTFDGGKIATFDRAYRARGLTPSEVDYAFFKDRAAHTSDSYAPIAAAIANEASAGVEHWRVRRAIALAVRPARQRADRLGRDVAFYVDGLGVPNLTPEELSAWALRGRRQASDVGLSDNDASTAGAAEPPIDESIAHPASLTPDERAPVRPRPGDEDTLMGLGDGATAERRTRP